VKTRFQPLQGPGALLCLIILLAAARLEAATPTLIWSDDFNQPDNSAPDPAKWTYDLGDNGWGNDELETYTDSRDNSYITTDPAATDGKALAIRIINANGSYTSARLKTQGLFNASYGRIEANLRVVNGDGLWPAFWLLGADIGSVGWPACGEIDVMEILGKASGKLYGTLHGPGYSGANGIGNTFTLPDGALFSDAYHVFAVDWSPNKIVWSVDGMVYHSVTPADLPAGTAWVFNNSPAFIILDLAVGGFFADAPDSSTPLQASYLVDYVRVYGLPSDAPTGGTATPAMSANQLNLSWTVPDLKGFALTGYHLDRATDSGFTQNLVQRDLGMATMLTDSQLAGGTTYYYRVSATTSGGTSDFSTVFSGTAPATDTTPPPMPTPTPTHPPSQGGGGGGAVSLWFLALLSLLSLVRRYSRHPR
jgi:beta-glucanase (GH16 family)